MVCNKGGAQFQEYLDKILEIETSEDLDAKNSQNKL